MKKYDSIIFDLDGTLWDTCEACAVAWNNVLKRNNIDFRKITASDVRGVTGKPLEDCIKTVFFTKNCIFALKIYFQLEKVQNFLGRASRAV